MASEPERMQLPRLAPVAPRPGFPVVASLAPLLVAVVLWALTSSPYALLFAILGPVVAVAGMLDGRRAARRARRRALSAAFAELAELARRIEAGSAERRAALERECPPLAALIAMDEAPLSGVTGWRLGTGDIPSGLELDGADAADDPGWERAVRELREQAATTRGGAVIVHAVDDVGVVGPTVLAHAFARAIVLQAAARCEPRRTVIQVPATERWARRLPHRVEFADGWEVREGGERIVRILVEPPGAIGRHRVELHLGDTEQAARIDAPTRVGRWRPLLVSAVEAEHRAKDIAERARRRGGTSAAELPAEVDLGALIARAGAAPGEGALWAPIGCDRDGVVAIDLDTQGPHALVAGTTGSGKSELLISWVLALAAAHPPRAVSFLLVDFKGGAAFAPLLGLPHVVGVVSDLDTETAARAVESLRAELRRREQLLARHGVRSIAELPPETLPRLVIVVDEFAALVAADAELHTVFLDLAARGRSLGLHLVLCTQRPAGVIREGVLANITLRICLRVLDAADSIAVVGDPGAAAITAASRGRAVLVGGGAPREVQLAIAAAGEPTAVAARWTGAPAPEVRPWLDPLPALLPGAALPPPATPGELVVGLVDRPDERRRDALAIDPWAHGALLVVGGTGSGRTTALAALARACRAPVRWVADDAAELWQAFSPLDGGGRVLVIADDLDRLLAAGDAEQRADLAELVSRVSRDARRTGVAFAASTRTAGGPLHGAQGAFEQRLLLRLPAREDHLLAGGEARTFRRARRPGSAVWQGREAQLVSDAAAPPCWRAPLPEVRLGEGRWSIATPRSAQWCARLAAAGCAVAPLGAGPAPVVVGDVDGWLGDYAALTTARAGTRLLLIGCTPADHRALTRARGPLPPLGGDDDAWLVDGATTTRVRLVLG